MKAKKEECKKNIELLPEAKIVFDSKKEPLELDPDIDIDFIKLIDNEF